MSKKSIDDNYRAREKKINEIIASINEMLDSASEDREYLCTVLDITLKRLVALEKEIRNKIYGLE